MLTPKEIIEALKYRETIVEELKGIERKLENITANISRGERELMKIMIGAIKQGLEDIDTCLSENYVNFKKEA